MVCDTRLKQGQTISERAAEVRRATTALERAIAARKVTVKVGPQGAVAFIGWQDSERDGITDNCAYRRLLATGSALARAEIARAEALAGRKVSVQAVGQGLHSHDGGKTWHGH
jgi:hypothetical protein